MSKTNFTKVEEALTEGLRKLTVAQLLKLADRAKNTSQASETKDEATSQQQFLSSLQRDLKELYKHGQAVYTKFGIKRSELKKLMEDPSSLTPQDWDKLKQLKKQVEAFKQEIIKNLPQVSDESIVEEERRKHINKRFNVKDKWIPLK